jgi:hypothetical protein
MAFITTDRSSQEAKQAGVELSRKLLELAVKPFLTAFRRCYRDRPTPVENSVAARLAKHINEGLLLADGTKLDWVYDRNVEGQLKITGASNFEMRYRHVGVGGPSTYLYIGKNDTCIEVERDGHLKVKRLRDPGVDDSNKPRILTIATQILASATKCLNAFADGLVREENDKAKR